MKHYFDDYLITLVSRKSADVNEDGIPSLEDEELAELCCLYALEDNSDEKDEILCPNYCIDTLQLIQAVARLCSEEYYSDPEDIEDDLNTLHKAATAAFVKYYSEEVNKIYTARMINYLEAEQTDDPEDN